MTIEKTLQGAWRVSTIHDNHLLTRKYTECTRREAFKMFNKLLDELDTNKQLNKVD